MAQDGVISITCDSYIYALSYVSLVILVYSGVFVMVLQHSARYMHLH